MGVHTAGFNCKLLHYNKLEVSYFSQLFITVYQGPKLRLTGRQCDQILGVGDQKFRTGRQPRGGGGGGGALDPCLGVGVPLGV